MLLQCRFDFAQLDPVSTDLNLRIEPVYKVERSVQIEIDQVARAIEPAAGALVERIRKEALGCKIGPPQVTAGYALTANE